MLMFTLAISCLTTSNLPWFMDLTFQVPMKYCSLQHRTLLPSPIISTTGHCFYFGSVSQFFLELFLHSSPVASLVVAQRVKRLPAMQETWVWSLGQEDPLEKEMANHSSTFAWKIPWMEKPSRLQSMGSQRVGHDWVTSLSLFLSFSPVAYWAPTDLGSSSFTILSFCLFILFMGFSRQEYWSGLPFPSPVDHILSEPSTMTCPSWAALQGMAHGFIELDKAVVHVISLISFLWL